MTSFNLPSPKGILIIILFIATLFYVSFCLGCKSKKVQCEAYSKVYDSSWQDEDWFDDDKLVQVDDTTFLIWINDSTLANIDSLNTLNE